MLEMNPKLFTLLQSDVDGAGLKVMNFARSLALMQPADKRHDPVTKHERQVGAPSLRNVGFQLVHVQRAAMLKNTFTRQKDFNDKAASIQSGGGATAPELFAEDTVRGFRIDIWDDTPKQWRSLCQRSAHYDLNSGQVIVDVPAEKHASGWRHRGRPARRANRICSGCTGRSSRGAAGASAGR